MIIKKIGKRGVIFTFEEDESPLGGGISIYLINTKDKLFLCDTHLGPESMKYINKYIKEHYAKKETIIFNSHADWDHIWGNCYFKDNTIIAHEFCRKRMLERGTYDLKEKKEYCNGEVDIVYPDLIFTERLRYVDENIEFIYAPGHTVDSAIVFDREDEIMFIGDLIEDPLPFVDYYDLQNYLKSLYFIKKQSTNFIITAHSGIANDILVDQNIQYIEKLAAQKPLNLDEQTRKIHKFNLKNIILAKYEENLRKKYGKEFRYNKCHEQIKKFRDMSYESLKEKLRF